MPSDAEAALRLVLNESAVKSAINRPGNRFRNSCAKQCPTQTVCSLFIASPKPKSAGWRGPIGAHWAYRAHAADVALPEFYKALTACLKRTPL